MWEHISYNCIYIAGPKAKQLEGEECPLHVKHPPTGEEFALGCGVCRNAHTF
jgi:E3 ubiquitin-protein ligase MYCBP2